MQRVDVQHHTPEMVAGYLKQALAILADEPLSDEAHAAVLPTLMNLLGSKTVHVQQDAPMMLPQMAIPRGRQ